MKPSNVRIEFYPRCPRCDTDNGVVFWSPVDYYETGFPVCTECSHDLNMKDDVHLEFTPEEVKERKIRFGSMGLVADRPTVQEAYDYAVNTFKGFGKTEKAFAGIALQVVVNTYAKLLAEGKLT